MGNRYRILEFNYGKLVLQNKDNFDLFDQQAMLSSKIFDRYFILQ